MKLKKNKRPGTAVYQFPYYKNEKGFLRIFLTKALFACALAFSGAGLFAVLLELDIDPVIPASTALLVCGVAFVLLGFFRRLYVMIFAAVLMLLFLWHMPLLDMGQDLLYQIFLVADGNLVKTTGILTQSELQDPLPFFTLLVVIYGMLCAFSSCQRFRPLAVMTFAEIMMIPAFLGQSLHFSQWMAVFIAAMFGMWAVTVAAAADATLSSGYSSNLHMSDYVYLKANKRLPPLERLHSDSLHFGKHLSHCFTVFIVTLLTLGITASYFPADGSMRLEEIAKSAISIGQNFGYWFYDFFGGSGLKGFFSADGGNISISGNIDPENLPSGNRPVAEIITENRDKLYLRGDIGYTFSGEQWISIANLDYSKIQTYSDYNVQQVLDSCAPEIQYYLMQYCMSRIFDYDNDYIKLQTVKVNYLQDINTLLIAGQPYVLSSFRQNDNFSIYGDFVAIANKGKVNSMRSAIMYCSDSYDAIHDLTVYWEYLGDMTAIRNDWDTLSLPLSYDEYSEYIKAYRDFVYRYYTDVPEAELANINGFLREVLGNEYLFPPMERKAFYIGEDDMATRNYYASYICDYLSSSGRYRYSLDTDNSAGDNTFLGNFLNETRAGHCALYATTMCLALRNMGVPARYVTGFTVADANLYKTDEDGYSYTLLEKDLHAWVEVYYDNIGWIPYDPTPSRGGSTSNSVTPIETTRPRTTPPKIDAPETSITTRPTETTTTTISSVPSISGTDESGTEGTAQGLDPEVVKVILIAVGAAVIVLIIGLSIAGALKTLRRKERTLIKFFRTGESVKAINEMFSFTLKMLEMSGVQRKNGETPTEFAKRADHAFRAGLGVGLEQAMRLFQKSEFDNAPVFSDEEQQLVYSTVSKLYGELMLSRKGPGSLITRIRLFGKVKLNRKDR